MAGRESTRSPDSVNGAKSAQGPRGFVWIFQVGPAWVRIWGKGVWEGGKSTFPAKLPRFTEDHCLLRLVVQFHLQLKGYWTPTSGFGDNSLFWQGQLCMSLHTERYTSALERD